MPDESIAPSVEAQPPRPLSAALAEKPASPLRPDFRRPVVAALLLAMVFTLFGVQWSLSHGRLSQDVTYDDSTYMYEAGRRLAVLHDKGLVAYVVNLYRDPPHAPFTDLGAEASFSLFGLHDWVPYVFVNGPVIFLLLLVLAYFGRRAGFRAQLVMMIFALTLPFVVIGLHEYRPDFPGALFTALGICLVVEATLYRTSPARERQWLLGGIFFGLALVTKAVFFVHTLTMEGLTIAGACGLTWWSATKPASWKEVSRRCAGIVALVALPSLAIWAPYILVNFRETFGYFYDFALGKNSHVSELKGGLAGSAYFYTVGYAGDYTLGPTFFVGLALYALCLGIVLRSKNRRELLLQGILLGTALVSITSIIVNKRENQYFGIPCEILLLFMLARAFFAAWPILCATRRRTAWGTACLGGLCVLNLCLLRPAVIWPYSVPQLNYVVSRNHSINEKLLDDIWRELGPRAAVPSDPPITFVTRGGLVTAPTFRWLALKAGRHLDFLDVFTDNNPETTRKGMEDAMFVVAPEDNAVGVYNQNASWELRFEVERILAANPNFRLVRRYPDSPGGPGYRLFINDDKMLEKYGEFGDLHALEGFLPWEGPYPQWHLGKVRWAIGPGSRFSLPAEGGGEFADRRRWSRPVRLAGSG